MDLHNKPVELWITGSFVVRLGPIAPKAGWTRQIACHMESQ